MTNAAANTMPTEAEILAADFGGETPASWIAIARDYDLEFGAGREVEAQTIIAIQNGWKIDFIGVLNGTPTAMVPERNGWRVAVFSADICRFRNVVISADKDGQHAQVEVTQKYSKPYNWKASKTVRVGELEVSQKAA